MPSTHIVYLKTNCTYGSNNRIVFSVGNAISKFFAIKINCNDMKLYIPGCMKEGVALPHYGNLWRINASMEQINIWIDGIPAFHLAYNGFDTTYSNCFDPTSYVGGQFRFFFTDSATLQLKTDKGNIPIILTKTTAAQK